MSENPSSQSVIQGGVESRPYQIRIVDKAIQMFQGTFRNGAGALEPAARSVLVESPTGSGKTTMGLLIARNLQLQTGARVGWVAMRRNLLQQVEAENLRHGIGCDFQTISMFEKNPPTDIDLLVTDEAQHDSASSCAHLHNVIQPRWILGLTATPFRSDHIKLCFDRVIRDVGIHQLIHDGYLAQYDHYTVPRWEVSQLAEFYCSDPVRWGKSIFFFRSLSECYALKQILQGRGISVDVVSGSSDRDQQLESFRRGSIQVLANCMVLTEGFDDPTLQTAWVRPSVKGPTIQMAGRVLRRSPDVPVKQIVQCQETSHPFPKIAMCRQQFLWQGQEWRSLTVNPHLNLCNSNVHRAIAVTEVELPKFLTRHQGVRRRAARPRRAGTTA